MQVLRRHLAGPSKRRRLMLFLAALSLPAIGLSIWTPPYPTSAATFGGATYSSPIALSADNSLVWVVNPDDDTVSVIRTDTDVKVTDLAVGDEPQSVALHPDNTFAYVANTAAGTVSVIRIQNASPGAFQASLDRTLHVGSEPWNVVTSPNGARVFVTGSSQDTVSVINTSTHTLIPGDVDLRDSVCNDPDRERHFQPRGMAVTADNTKLYVTRFLSFTRPGGVQASDVGKEGLVCRLDINTSVTTIGGYTPAAAIALAPQLTGFATTSAFPNQIQSIVIRGDRAYLPNIAASPERPLLFNQSTMAFINQIGGVTGPTQTDLGALNAHLGARDPEAGKQRIFFANVWGIGFTTPSGAGNAYVVSAGSDLLVKLNVDAAGVLSNTVDADTTRYVDLNDPANPATSGVNAGKNPLGIVVNPTSQRAYVMNFVSRNVSVVNLAADVVSKVIQTGSVPVGGSNEEIVQVGAELFFSSRGNFSGPGTPTRDRLSSEGWQNCGSCHPAGLSDGVVWQFGAGPRKSIPLNSSFNPNNPNQQRVFNYSAIFDEVQDFDLNIRNVSGPGAAPVAVPCANPPPATSTFRTTHGLIIGDNGDVNTPPCTINAFALPNDGRQQVTVTLPGGQPIKAWDALEEWFRRAIRTPNGPKSLRNAPGGLTNARQNNGRSLFAQRCQTCHGGSLWTIGVKDFVSPPAAGEIFTETTPPPVIGNPVAAQYLDRFLRNINSFNLGVLGQGNPIGNNIGGVEIAANGQDGLGRDYNGDGRGVGFNVPSLLGIHASQPFYHNGACETLACVLSDINHVGAVPTAERPAIARFVESIDASTTPPGSGNRRRP